MTRSIDAARRQEGRMNEKYYTAYEERYKTAHQKGVSWASDACTPIVMDVIRRYRIQPEHDLLELGCGEGRDSKVVLENGFRLSATDISEEAISYCRKNLPRYARSFSVLDFLSDETDACFDFIYAVAVIHMLVPDEDRNGFYRFIRDHLKPDGLALICTMGDGETEMQSDVTKAFEIQERDHESGKMLVAATSCRMVSFGTFAQELAENGLSVTEKGITSSLPEFDKLMYAVVKNH